MAFFDEEPSKFDLNISDASSASNSSTSLSHQNDLLRAIFEQDVDTVKEILSENSSSERTSLVTSLDANSRSPLHAACFMGCLEIVEAIIESYDKDKIRCLNSKDKNGQTPLHLACQKNNHEIVKLLISEKADPVARDKTWLSPLHVAAINNSLESARILATSVNNINIACRQAQTALHKASIAGNSEIVAILLENGANAACMDKNDRRPIHWAAAKRHASIVSLLVEKEKENIQNSVDKKGKSILHAAAAGGCVDIAMILAGMDHPMDVKDNNLDTPLHIACLNGKFFYF